MTHRKREYKEMSGSLTLATARYGKNRSACSSGGCWNGRQIVSKAWIDASMTSRIEATGLYVYGYLRWLGRSLHNGREVHWAGALGRGGQSIRGFLQGCLAGDFVSGLNCKRPAPALVCLWPVYAKRMAVDRKANVNHERQHLECQHLSMADALIAKAERVIREAMQANLQVMCEHRDLIIRTIEEIDHGP